MNSTCMLLEVVVVVRLDFDRRPFGQSKDYFGSRKKGRIQYDYRK